MAKEFSLLIDKSCPFQDLHEGAQIRGSGEGGVVDLVVVASRKSGGGFKDEGHFLHVKAAANNHFDNQHPIKKIEYGKDLKRCDVKKCEVLKE
ncbi:MAG TPA: hypothetical protein VFQ45_19580 [Longimicrobium sp.]|nr:hypothetical protein [Longimicrobium sp.]